MTLKHIALNEDDLAETLDLFSEWRAYTKNTLNPLDFGPWRAEQESTHEILTNNDFAG